MRSALPPTAELAALVRHSAEQGTLDVSTATLLTRSIGLGALTAVDVMTDRGRVHALPRTASAADVVAASVSKRVGSDSLAATSSSFASRATSSGAAAGSSDASSSMFCACADSMSTNSTKVSSLSSARS